MKLVNPSWCVAAAAALSSAAAWADTCPYLDAKVAAEALLGMPTAITVERGQGAGGGKGSATTCRFKEAGELVAQLAIIVTAFDAEADATAAYERQLTSQGSRAGKSSIGASPAFFTMNPGFSAASYARKGKQVVYVSHVFGKRVNEAIAKDPDGSVISTHEIAWQVLGKL